MTTVINVTKLKPTRFGRLAVTTSGQETDPGGTSSMMQSLQWSVEVIIHVGPTILPYPYQSPRGRPLKPAHMPLGCE